MGREISHEDQLEANFLQGALLDLLLLRRTLDGSLERAQFSRRGKRRLRRVKRSVERQSVALTADLLELNMGGDDVLALIKQADSGAIELSKLWETLISDRVIERSQGRESDAAA